jgi:GntR family transcriptional regulator / MocR family aminotransferase
MYVASGRAIRSNFVSIQWSGLGPELLVRLDRHMPEPLRAQLERELREAIRSRRLGAGERLPSSRALARELGVSRGLVQECYAQLWAEGYLVTRSGSGTRVAAGAASETSAAVREPAPVVRLAVDFRPGRPDLTSFPRADWAWATREACRTASADALGYGDPRGSARLREVIAAYLRRVRGTVARPDRIVVCTGFAQGLNLTLRALARDGIRRVALEDPGHVERDEVARCGLDGIPVAVDVHGIDVDALAASGARAVVLTPAHQSPTGVVLAPERRQALVEWADGQNATIIEDDYDAEFRYDREPIGALQGLAPDRVVAIGTVSKSLAPAVRLGWIVCPPHLMEQISDEKQYEDRGSPGLDQIALASLIESGRFDKHLRRMRAHYAAKRRKLIDALSVDAPHIALTGLAAGFHAIAHLPESIDEPEIVAEARERSIGLYPMSRYRADHDIRPPQLVLGFGDLSEGAIQRGITEIADLLGQP